MEKVQFEETGRDTRLELRRRTRRVRMIVDMTRDLIRREPSLSAREAQCLVECARKAIHDLFPDQSAHFDLIVVPYLESVVRDRWPNSGSSARPSSREMIN